MNESALVIADFIPPNCSIEQITDIEDFDLIKLFRKSKKNNRTPYGLIVTDDPKGYLKKLESKIKTIRAAGGLVKNGKGRYLFIYRLGKWDLPKGKVDANEKSRQTAVREVEEECGVKIDYLGLKILSTYHMYELKGDVILKRTDWYEMAVNKNPKLIPQLDEDITKAVWIKEPFNEVLVNTYPLIKDVLEKSLKISKVL